MNAYRGIVTNGRASILYNTIAGGSYARPKLNPKKVRFAKTTKKSHSTHIGFAVRSGMGNFTWQHLYALEQIVMASLIVVCIQSGMPRFYPLSWSFYIKNRDVQKQGEASMIDLKVKDFHFNIVDVVCHVSFPAY